MRLTHRAVLRRRAHRWCARPPTRRWRRARSGSPARSSAASSSTPILGRPPPENHGHGVDLTPDRERGDNSGDPYWTTLPWTAAEAAHGVATSHRGRASPAPTPAPLCVGGRDPADPADRQYYDDGTYKGAGLCQREGRRGGGHHQRRFVTRSDPRSPCPSWRPPLRTQPETRLGVRPVPRSAPSAASMDVYFVAGPITMKCQGGPRSLPGPSTPGQDRTFTGDATSKYSRATRGRHHCRRATSLRCATASDSPPIDFTG